MNKAKIYNLKYTDYAAAQAAYNAQREEFEKYALTRANAHIANARTILAKYNRGRQEPFTSIPGMPWLTKKLTFKEFSEEGLIFTYPEMVKTTGWNAKTTEVQREFLFRTEWLSLSTWAFNKQIRDHIKKYIADETENRKNAEARRKQDEINALRKKIRDSLNEQDKLRKQIEQLQKNIDR